MTGRVNWEESSWALTEAPTAAKKEAKRSGKEIKRRGGEKEEESRVEKAEGTTFTLRGRL